MRWRSDLTDEQRAALDRALSELPGGSYPETRALLRAAFAAPEPRTREGWVMPLTMDDRGCSWMFAPSKTTRFKTRVLVIELPDDADAAAVERVRRAALEAMP